VLELPKVGPLVRDYRAGLGMPKRAKVTAVTMIVAACCLSAVVVASPVVSPIILAAGAVGVWYVTTRVATSPL
jgi:uncharacterized membrane protein YbaN (DUF454 family)